jgi:hypothetical protein
LIGAWALASVATWVLVLLVPVTFARPDLSTLDPVHRWVLGRVYRLDPAHVTFPCLHSALTWISWWALRDRGPRVRALVTVLAVAIPLSTMTTRQHLVTDNAAALVIAWACARTMLPGGYTDAALGVGEQLACSPEGRTQGPPLARTPVAKQAPRQRS